MKLLCTVKNCNRKQHCRGLCGTHYTRLWRYNNVYAKKTSALKNPFQAAINCVFGKYELRAEKKKLAFELTTNEFELLTSQNCHYCGNSPMSSYKTVTNSARWIYNGIDRIDNTKGYIKGNMVPCCKICNRAKLNMTLRDFKSWVRNLYKLIDVK